MEDIAVVSLLITFAGLVASVFSTILFCIAEKLRLPVLEFLPYDDVKTLDNDRYMWHHLKVRVKKAPLFFNRERATDCTVRVDFLEKATGNRLVDQIECHWTGRPEPKTNGAFDPTKVPDCQRKDVGFQPEKFDILLKFESDEGFYATHPWVIYRFARGDTEYEKFRITTGECVIRVEIQAANLYEEVEHYFLVENTGRHCDAIKIVKLPPPSTALMKRLRQMVDVAAMLIFVVCVYCFLLSNDVFSGIFTNDALPWYFLAKGIFCSLALMLLVRVLAVLQPPKT